MNQELTQEQALSVLIQGVRIAQKAGAFSLEDAELIAKAIRVFVKPEASTANEIKATQSVEEEVKS